MRWLPWISLAFVTALGGLVIWADYVSWQDDPRRIYTRAVELFESAQVDLARGAHAFEDHCAKCHTATAGVRAPVFPEALAERVRADERSAARYILESAVFPDRARRAGYEDEQMWPQLHVGEQSLADIAAMLIFRIKFDELAAPRPR